MIKIATLRNCEICKNYRNNLTNANISYIELDCSDSSNCDKCDELENISKSNLYPFTIVNDKHIVALTTEYEKLNTIINNYNYTIIYSYSINNMLDIVNKLLDL